MDTTRQQNRRGRLFAVATAIGLTLALGACGDDDDAADNGAPDAPPEEGSSSADATLEIDSNNYTNVTAPAGGTLEIVNASGAGHTFTADEGAFDEAVGGDDTVDIAVPSEAGDYPFHCEIHPTMQATLTVQ